MGTAPGCKGLAGPWSEAPLPRPVPVIRDLAAPLPMSTSAGRRLAPATWTALLPAQLSQRLFQALLLGAVGDPVAPLQCILRLGPGVPRLLDGGVDGGRRARRGRGRRR